MPQGVSRRELVRGAALAAGTASIAAWLAACSSGDVAGPPSASGAADDATTPSTTAAASTTPATAPSATEIGQSGTTDAPTTPPPTASSAPPTTAAVDRARPWWLQGNFAPVQDEIVRTDLTVVGAIPPELEGMYVRNGSNPRSGTSPHWFFGDGMVHGVRLERGRAAWYGNRFVQTSMYTSGAGFGQGPPGGASNQSNVSCIWHGGRLLTSGEVGLPYELDPSDLSTLGPHDFGGRLTTAFTAHPKTDPVTGRMHFFGYGFTPPYLTYHIAEPDGSLVHSEAVELPRSTMMHDFAITDTDAIFWDLPVVFDLDAAIAYIADPANAAFPYRWAPESGARVGVMPLAGGADAIQWFELDPCYVFHGVNAYRAGDDVVVDVCRLESMFAPGELFGGAPSLRRWTLQMSTGTATDDVIEVDNPGDLPTRDPRRVGRRHRHAYLLGTRPNPDTVELAGLIKHDYDTGRRETWDPGPTAHAGEWLFVPGTDGASADDEGWLLSIVHDEAADRSELVIVDATHVPAGPVARIELPRRVPYGFHGTWVPAG